MESAWASLVKVHGIYDENETNAQRPPDDSLAAAVRLSQIGH